MLWLGLLAWTDPRPGWFQTVLTMMGILDDIMTAWVQECSIRNNIRRYKKLTLVKKEKSNLAAKKVDEEEWF